MQLYYRVYNKDYKSAPNKASCVVRNEENICLSSSFFHAVFQIHHLLHVLPDMYLTFSYCYFYPKNVHHPFNNMELIKLIFFYYVIGFFSIYNPFTSPKMFFCVSLSHAIAVTTITKILYLSSFWPS